MYQFRRADQQRTGQMVAAVVIRAGDVNDPGLRGIEVG